MSNSDVSLNSLVKYLHSARNFHLAEENRQFFEKALAERMKVLTVPTVADYIDHLEVHPDECIALFDCLKPTGTSFFADSQLWDLLQQKVVPALCNPQMSQLRVWSAGCTSRFEPYGLAILICEQLGDAAFQQRVKIFATDEDEGKLSQARLGSFSEDDLIHLSEAVRKKYFTRSNGKYTFRGDYRRSIIFGRHDVSKDPAISRLDLILCRNLLLRHDAEVQRRILVRLRFALNADGYILLGPFESLPMTPGLHETDLSLHLYKRDSAPSDAIVNGNMSNGMSHEAALRVRDAAYDASPVAQVILDENGAIVLANSKARLTFGLSNPDFGRPFQDLELSYRPVELRSIIDQALREDRTMAVNRVTRHLSNNRTEYFDVSVRPINGSSPGQAGVCIQFQDLSDYYHLQDQLVSANQQLQTANEELQSAHEELETTNEELQSSNEELETTNEELQSTNEELETINEELRSTNIELASANDEQQATARSAEQTHSFLESILFSMQNSVIVLDTLGQVQVWNERCADLWGLRGDEVYGKVLFDLDIGLPLAALKNKWRSFVQLKKEHDELTLDGINRRGRSIRCHISITPLASPDLSGTVLLVHDEPR